MAEIGGCSIGVEVSQGGGNEGSYRGGVDDSERSGFGELWGGIRAEES